MRRMKSFGCVCLKKALIVLITLFAIPPLWKFVAHGPKIQYLPKGNADNRVISNKIFTKHGVLEDHMVGYGGSLKLTDKMGLVKFLQHSLERSPPWCRYVLEGTLLFQFLTQKMGIEYVYRPLLHSKQQAGQVPCVSKTVLYIPQSQPELQQRFKDFVEQTIMASSMSNTVLNGLCSYNVSLIHGPSEEHPSFVTYEIREYISEISSDPRLDIVRNLSQSLCTQGGSTFKVLINGPKTRSFCTTMSFANGTYFMACKLREDMAKITIYRTAFNYGGLTLGFPRKRHIFTGLLPPLRNQSETPQGEGQGLCRNIGTLFAHSPSYWTRVDAKGDLNPQDTALEGSRWEFMVGGICPLSLVTKPVLEECLVSRANNVFFIGDTHLRLMYFYTLMKLDEGVLHVPWKLLPLDIKSEQFFFKWSPYIADTTKVLTNTTRLIVEDSGHSNSKPDILIINVGLADLEDFNITGYLKEIESLFSQLKILSENKMHRFRIIWLGMPSIPDDNVENNQEIMALNGWMYNRLADIGVEIFDVFSILYPFNNACIWGKACMYIDPADQKVKGDLGVAFVEMLLHFICK